MKHKFIYTLYTYRAITFYLKTYNCLAANAKFCTSPLNFSTCGNARFQLIKLCNRNKSSKITTNLAEKFAINKYFKLKEIARITKYGN